MSQLNLKDIFREYSSNASVFANKEALGNRYVPDIIPHREDKIKQIAKTIAPALRGQRVSNIFIYGTVGTGKTVSVNYAASELGRLGGEPGSIRIIYINCKMKNVSDTEYRLLAELSRSLGREVPVTGLPTDQVYRIFFEELDSREQSVILILDEIDALVKKIGDGILYNLTRINQDLKRAKLSIIGISNDLSFTEDLDPRVKSSLSEEEIIFPPYNATQLRDILEQRAEQAFSEGALDSGVIPKCAALAAQEHGDARRALDLLRIAGEIVEREGGFRIATEHIDKAESKLDLDKTVEVVRAQPMQSQAVLAGIIRLADGHEKIQTGDVFPIYESICSGNGLKPLTQRRVSDLIGGLDMLGIINVKVISRGRYGRTREIRTALSGNILERVKGVLMENGLLGG